MTLVLLMTYVLYYSQYTKYLKEFQVSFFLSSSFFLELPGAREPGQKQ